MHFKKFQQDDKVTYKGTRFARELHGKLGVVCSRVQNRPSGVVVDFGDDAYVMDESNLSKFVPSKEQESKGVEIQVQRRKRSSEDEES
jgi:hypothetical protein